MRAWRLRSVGLGGVLLAVAAVAAVAAAERPPVVVVTLDTTRPDHLGCYGYGRDTSPNLDRLAADSTLFTRAYSTSSWTLPAHASLFTGKFPSSHGARLDPEGPLILGDAIEGPEFLGLYRASGLAQDQRTLAQILSDAGYRTGAVVAGPWLKRAFGLDRGFAHYDDAQISSWRGRLAEQVTDAALTWLDGLSGDRPFLLFLNYYDPHAPYSDPEGMARHFLPPDSPVYPVPSQLSEAQRSAYYDGEILYMDRHIGRLLDGLRERGLYDRSIVVVTADHGELLGEHGRFGHGKYLWEEELRVPLLVKRPRGEAPAGRSDERVQLADVFRMLLERLDLAVPGGVKRAEDPAYAEVYPLATYSDTGSWRALYDGDRKLLWSSYGRHRIFDLARDPGEVHDLLDGDAKAATALAARIESFAAALPAPGGSGPVRGIDEETRRALEGLGYLED